MRYFFEEAQARADQLLFTDAPGTSPIKRSANYGQMESRAGKRRQDIELGLNKLDGAIRKLLAGGPEDAKSFLIIIQMVAEAVRYWDVEWRVLQGSSFHPDSRMIAFENSWDPLSEQIQNSDVFAFQWPIHIGDEVVDSLLSPVISALFLMLFQCRPPNLLHMPRGQGRCKQLIDPATEILRRDLGLSLDPRLQMDQDDTCRHLADPRSRIMGRDGLCVDVQGFNYRDGNPVVLSTCKSSDLRNQLWNFGTDGRIVSMEKCLAASGFTRGSTVMIHECDTLPKSKVQWAMTYSGTLSNRHSGLVLDASSGSGKQLTLQSDIGSSFQAWRSTNVTTGVDVYIHGENNQCIYYNGKYGVYAMGCRKDYSWQKWRLHPDGTIRPVEWLEGCLEVAYTTLTSSYNYIQAGYCSSNPEKHRWIFTHKRSIVNLKSHLVVDADSEYPGKGYLKAAPFKGGLNQIWTLQFI